MTKANNKKYITFMIMSSLGTEKKTLGSGHSSARKKKFNHLTIPEYYLI